MVTSITDLGYSIFTPSQIKIIKFEDDSSVSTIYGRAFSKSNIKEIYFPKSLNELREGWCYETRNLKKITISPSNKSDINKDEFDILSFVRRDIEEISIPSNIKIIGSCSFDHSNITSIFIPSNLTKICEHAFSRCSNLRKIYKTYKIKRKK